MPKNPDIKKVLVLGSGPIIIGQAAEFDYAGTQACRSLKEEGVEVVLLNSNPATIMTDKDIADRVYIEPLTVEVVEQLILKEKPDSVLPTLGGQAGLNLAMELEDAGFLKEHDVRLIGTTAHCGGCEARPGDCGADRLSRGAPSGLYPGRIRRRYCL